MNQSSPSARRCDPPAPGSGPRPSAPVGPTSTRAVRPSAEPRIDEAPVDEVRIRSLADPLGARCRRGILLRGADVAPAAPLCRDRPARDAVAAARPASRPAPDHRDVRAA